MDYYAAHQVVIVLVGLIGSGKSAFATALQSYYPNFTRCNQDELGNRKAVEAKVHEALSTGRSVCVDRTNVEPSQRRTWIEIGRSYDGVEVWCVEMDVDKEICLERLSTRKNHPTIKDMQAARRVIDIFGTQYKTPCVCEGFDLVFTIPPYCIPSTPPVAETLVTDETTLPPPTSTSPSIPNPPLIYSPSSILAILNNFTLAAQYPYRPKRLDVLPLDPRHAAAAPLTPSSQSSQLVRTWRPSGNGSGGAPGGHRGPFRGRGGQDGADVNTGNGSFRGRGRGYGVSRGGAEEYEGRGSFRGSGRGRGGYGDGRNEWIERSGGGRPSENSASIPNTSTEYRGRGRGDGGGASSRGSGPPNLTSSTSFWR